MDGPRCLDCLSRPILGGGHTCAVFELFGEAAGIDEAGFAGDLGGGGAGFIEEAHGGRTRVLMWNSWGLNLQDKLYHLESKLPDLEKPAWASLRG